MAYAQTSGGGPFTHGPNLSFTYNGGSACYPYQVQAQTSTGSVYSCVGGIMTLPIGSGGGGSGSQTPWTQNINGGGYTLTNVGNVGIGTWVPALPLSVTGDSYLNGNIGIGTTITTAGAALSVMNGNVGIGTWKPEGFVTIENPTYTTNLLELNNGTTGRPNAFPNSWTPTLTVNDSEVSGSRPLFFGYKSGTGWDTFMTIGACGSFDQMCLDLGSGSTVLAALIYTGTNMSIGGNSNLSGSFYSADGNANNIYFGNTGSVLMPNSNVGIGTNSPVGGLSVMNGNVGIGTWVPAGALDIKTGNNVLVESGNVGIGTTRPPDNLYVVGTINTTGGYKIGSAVGASGSGATSCICKTFVDGICTVMGTCT